MTVQAQTLHVENPISIALKIAEVSNLKFLKLFPGAVSGARGWGGGLLSWVSVIVMLLLLPLELVFAFHTLIPEQRSKEQEINKWESYDWNRLHHYVPHGEEQEGPLTGMSGLEATGGLCVEIHVFKYLYRIGS